MIRASALLAASAMFIAFTPGAFASPGKEDLKLAAAPAAASASATANETGEYWLVPEAAPVIGFMAPREDFGVVEKGEVIKHQFEFLNNGTADLLLQDAKAIVPGVGVGISHAPVPSGETGNIFVTLKTEHMDGEQFIRIKVQSNAINGSSTLYISLDVQPPAEETDNTDS